jgi:S1-C subfamily serine protease
MLPMVDMKQGILNVILIASFLIGILARPATATSLNIARKSVFKIMVDTSVPSFSEPWKRQSDGGGTGTGFYIGNNQILTNAHVVAYGTYIKVLRDGDSTPIPALVKFIAHDCDLAILEPLDPQSLDDVREVEFGRVPRLQSPVVTVGFPTGGDQLSITQGIVSRISFRRYVHDGISDHLLIQVDSAINPGNSGGPVFQGGSVIGVAFQAYTQAENTGYIIPTPVIRHFLKDIEDGVYDGHPADGLSTMEGAMENSSSGAFLGLKKEDGGVKISVVAPWSSAAGKIHSGDVLLEIDGQPIGNDGKINFMGERVSFRVVYDLKQAGESVTFKLNHDGTNHKVTFPVGHLKPYPRTGNSFARHPKYFVYGGLVFTTLTRSFLKNWGERWYNEAPLNLRYMVFNWPYLKEVENVEDIVVLAKLLPDQVNTYARSNVDGIVKSVDNKTVDSIKDLVQLLEKGESEYAVIEFHNSDEPTVLSRGEVKLRTPLINKKYSVEPDRWLFGEEEDAAMAEKSKTTSESKN